MTKRNNHLLYSLLCLFYFALSLTPVPAQKGQNRYECDIEQLPLISAALKGYVKRVKFLLAHGTDVNTRGMNGRTALLEIAQQGNLPMLTLLVVKGANINARDTKGNSALKLVVSGPAAASDVPVSEPVKRQEINLLLKYGAQVNAKDKDGDTALIESMIAEPMSLPKILVAHGADVGAHGSGGQTALMTAAAFYEGQVAFDGHGASNLQLLISHGASVNARDSNRATALFYGVTDQYGTMLVWDVYSPEGTRKKSLAEVLKEMPGQSEVEEIEALHFLLSHGADVNARDKDGKTVLTYAQGENHSKLVAELENSGAKE